MRLAFAARGLDQRVVVKPIRLRQHRRRDLYQIVERQRADGHRRRGVDRREAARQQRLGGGLDVTHEALEHVVEQRDLLVRVVDGAVEKEIGDAAQRLHPARDGAVRERGLQLVEQANGGDSGLRIHLTLSWSKGRRRILHHRKLKMIGSGAGDAIASPCLGCVKRAVGAREKGVGGFVRQKRCDACGNRHAQTG